MQQQDAKTELRKLARTIARQYRASDFTKLMADSESRALEGRKAGEFYTALVLGEEYAHFLRVLSALRRLPSSEHQTDGELRKALNDYVLKLEREREALTQGDALKDSAETFLDTVLRPLEPYEAVWEMKRLNLGDDSLSDGTVTLETFTLEMVGRWNFPYLDDSVEKLEGKVVALTTVEAGDNRSASDKVERAIDASLDVFRYAFTAVRPNAIDNDFRFERASFHLLRPLSDPTQITYGRSLGVRPIDRNVSPKEAEYVNDLLGRVGLIRERIGSDLAGRLRRTLRWIGSSTAHTNYDDKILALCSGLEAALLPEDSGLKGDLLAVRVVLLSVSVGEPSVDAIRLFRLYESRSDLSHGSDIDLCTEQDYLFLRSVSVMVLRQTMELLERKPAIADCEGFLDALLEEPSVSEAEVWLENLGSGARKIRERLNELVDKKRA